MSRKILKGGLFLLLGLLALGGGLFVFNATPAVAPVSAAEAANPSMPYVVKLHAQWCPVCMLTKHEWTEIENAYAGRVNLVVFDSTTGGDQARSQAEADRLGLREVLDAYHGATGMVLIIDPRSREVIAQVGGNQSFDAYREAIDSAL